MLKPQWYRLEDKDWFLFPVDIDKRLIKSRNGNIEVFTEKEVVIKYIKLFKKKYLFFFEKVSFMSTETFEDGEFILADKLIEANKEEINSLLSKVDYPWSEVLKAKIRSAKNNFFVKFSNEIIEELKSIKHSINFTVDKFIEETERLQKMKIGSFEYKMNMLDHYFDLDFILERKLERVKEIREKIIEYKEDK